MSVRKGLSLALILIWLVIILKVSSFKELDFYTIIVSFLFLLVSLDLSNNGSYLYFRKLAPDSCKVEFALRFIGIIFTIGISIYVQLYW